MLNVPLARMTSRRAEASILKPSFTYSTPVAVVERAYASDQRVTTATLGTIATTAQDAGVANPAVIVIGDVVDVPGLVADRTLTTVGA